MNIVGIRKVLESRLYIGLGMLLAALITIVWSNFTGEWWCSLLQNLGAGLLTSLLLIFLYDRILEKRAQLEMTTRRAVALRRLVFAVRRHIETILFDMYRSSVDSRPSESTIRYSELVRSRLGETIPFLNFMAPAASSYPRKVIYGIWMAETFDGFRKRLESWLATYATSAENSMVAKVEQLLESEFLNVICQFERIVEAHLTIPEFRSRMALGSKPQVDKYAAALAELVDLLERETRSNLGSFDDTAWVNEFFEVGHARIELKG